MDRGDDLPLGMPQLMMSATKDWQIHPDIVQGRDEWLNTDSRIKQDLRQSIADPIIPAGADVDLRQ